MALSLLLSWFCKVWKKTFMTTMSSTRRGGGFGTIDDDKKNR